MAYYALSQKRDVGCPVGLLNAVVTPEFIKNPHRTDYGYFPWYANISAPKGVREPFPSGLFGIFGEKLIDFDIRSDSIFFYFLSEEFYRLSLDFGLRYEDAQYINIVSRNNAPIAKKKYLIARIVSTDIYEICSREETDIFTNKYDEVRIRRLVLASDYSYDIVKIGGVHYDTLLCSQRFKDAFESKGLKGVDFINIDTPNAWPALKVI